ncbi:FAD-dependent oxidoreductase [Streptomyces sp. NPDC002994]|uniref:NAD(P)/FAD-dependent oxidoreductase n=1 Tax=Streptomyces sp. NPDC002994 TaxID=3154441 RepID=UPI0033B1E714
MSGEVVVVGGGVAGLATGVVLAESGWSVRVWTREPVERTCSAVAGALWWPYRIEPAELVGDWSVESLRVYERLARTPEETGVRLVGGVMAGTTVAGLGAWGAEVAGLRDSAGGLRAVLPLIDMVVHLRYLRERLEAAGGVVELRDVTRLGEAAPSVGHTVVNCTGIGARSLVPDAGVRAVRGQLVVVENPGVEEWFVGATGGSESVYFFPQPYGLVLGGTAQEDDWRQEPDPAVARGIVERCAGVRPEVAGARVLEHRVGLRPARVGGVRLEGERLASGGWCVHNYGHGGAGVTVAWGCAREAARLVGGAGVR